MPRHPYLLPIILLVVAMISVQAGASIAKGLFPLIGPMATTTLRLTLGAAMLVLFVRPWRHFRTQGFGWLLAYGASLGLMNLTFYLGLQTIPLGLLVAIEFLGPLTVAVLASRRRIDFVWPLLAVGGLLLLLPIGIDASAALDPVGVAFALAAATCWGIYIVVGRRAGQAYGPRTAALGMVVAAVVAGPIGAADAGPALLSPRIVATALAMGLLASAIPNALEMYALTRLPLRSFGVLMSGEPVVAALAGYALLGERLLPLQMLAMALIVGASLGSVLTAERPAVADHPD